MGKYRAGESGNLAGRPRGTKAKSTALRESLSEGLPEIIQAISDAAKSGDVGAAKLVLAHTLPPMKPTDEPVRLRLSGNLAERAGAVTRAVAGGRITPDQGHTLMQTLASEARITETSELVARVAAIERALAPQSNDASD